MYALFLTLNTETRQFYPHHLCWTIFTLWCLDSIVTLTFILWFVVISSDSTLWRKFKSSQPFSFSHICFVLMTTFWMITGVGCNLNCIQEQLNFEWQQKLAAALLNALSVAFDGNRKCWMQNLNVSLKLSDRLSHVSFWFPTARLCCLRGTQKVSVSVWVWVCLWSIFSNSCPFP